jgi:hypothetical protein
MANVHKDFHGALSFGLDFLEQRFGKTDREAFLRELAGTVYAPLVTDLKERGLPALADHWRRIFDLEEGIYKLRMEKDELILEVERCPALAHMRERGYRIADHFCETTRLVNAAVCAAAGYEAVVRYDQAAGHCEQRFRKAAS